MSTQELKDKANKIITEFNRKSLREHFVANLSKWFHVKPREPKKTKVTDSKDGVKITIEEI